MGNPLRRRAGARKVWRNTAAGFARLNPSQQSRAQGSRHHADR